MPSLPLAELPRGFVKIRHYGLLAHRQRAEKLQRSRRLLLPLIASATLAAVPTSTTSNAVEIAPAQLPTCPQCGGCRFVHLALPDAREAAEVKYANTS